MILDTTLKTVIVIGFVVYMAERIPMVIRLCKALKLSFYRKQLEAAQALLLIHLEEAKNKAMLDWAKGGGKVAEAFVDRQISALGFIPGDEVQGVRERELAHVRNIYVQFVRIESLREMRKELNDGHRLVLVGVGYDVDEIERTYASAA